MSRIPGWLRAMAVLGGLALAFGALGASRRLDESSSNVLFFVAWCAAVLLIFLLALRLPLRPGGTRSRAALGNGMLAAAAIAVALLANVAVYRHDLHVDLSREGINTPPPQLQSVVQGLQSNISLTYFYNAADGNALAARALLTVASRENQHFHFRAVDLDREPAIAHRLGVHAYNTAVLEADDHRVIVENTVDLAQIAYAVLRVLKQRVDVVCFVTGHGESFPETPAHFHFSHLETLRGHNVPGGGDVLVGDPEGVDSLQLAVTTVGYTVRRIVPATLTRIPDDCALVTDIGPRRPYARGETKLFSDYLGRGGHMLLMIDPGLRIEQEFAGFLGKLGVASEPALIIDPLNHYGTDETKVAVPYYPPHPITKRVALTIFPDARPIRVTPPPVGITASVLARSSDDSYLRPLRQTPEATEASGTFVTDANPSSRGPVILAVALEGSWPDAPASEGKLFRLVLVGNSSFATNAYFPYVSNGDLVLGMVRWLAGDEWMPTVQPQSFSPDQIVLTQRQMRDIFIMLELVLPLSVLLFGGIVWWRRR
jgi:ABC-2 type transport system permease protein